MWREYARVQGVMLQRSDEFAQCNDDLGLRAVPCRAMLGAFDGIGPRRTLRSYTMADKANWLTIDPTTLPAIIQEDYRQYKDAYTIAKRQRETFETALRKAVSAPAGQRLAVNYNFGKLSVAFVADDAKAASSKGAVAFATLTR